MSETGMEEEQDWGGGSLECWKPSYVTIGNENSNESLWVFIDLHFLVLIVQEVKEDW